MRAAREAARLADELAALHRDLAPLVMADPELRAAWYRLDDATRTCRRAAEELDPAPSGRAG